MWHSLDTGTGGPPKTLSVALLSHHDINPTDLTSHRIRLVRTPGDIRSDDDVMLFYGAGMASALRGFSLATRSSLPPAVVLATHLDWDDVRLALDHGAVSYLVEPERPDTLSAALRCTARGETVLAAAIAAEQRENARLARAAAAARPVTGPDRWSFLSQRETELISLLASGRGVRDAAREMSVTERTVRNYLSRIYAKLGARNQVEAVLIWLGHLEPANHPATRGSGNLLPT